MFCEKCGTKNPDGAKFCEKCGTKLVQEAQGVNQYTRSTATATYTQTQTVQAPKVPRKPMNKKTKVLIIAAVVLIAAGVGVFNLAKSMVAPDKVVSAYFDSFISGDYEAAYEYLDVTDSEFISAEMFGKAMTEMYGEGENTLLNYSVAESKESDYYSYFELPETQEDGLKKKYIVKYTLQGDSETYEMYVTLLRQNSKKWLFFDNYKVAADIYIANDYEIQVPNGAAVYVDEILLDDSFMVEKEDGQAYLDYYSIPAIFEGTYDMKVTSPLMKDENREMYAEDGDYHRVSMVQLNDETNTELQVTAEEFIKAYITGAIDGKEFSSLSKYFSSEANISSLEKTYNNIAARKFDQESGQGVKEITFGSFNYTVPEEYSLGSYYKLSGDYEYDYTSYIKYWGDEEATEYSPEEYETRSNTVSFIYEDGEWKIGNCSINIYLNY